MAGRIEHDEYPLGPGLMFGHASTQRLGAFGHLKELLAPLIHVAHGRQAVDTDVEVHPHLLLAGDCWPDGRHEGLLSLELELAFAGWRLTNAQPPGSASERSTTFHASSDA